MQKKELALDQFARLEVGFRIQSTPESYRELEELLGAETKVDWVRNKAHPSRTRYFAIPAEIGEKGRIAVPKTVVNAFDRYGGFLMVKLVTQLPIGHYASLAMYHRLWGFDKVAPQRDNGDWVYSMPIHGLDKPGEGRKFFFVIRLDRAETEEKLVRLTVDRFEVTRGKEHFTLIRKKTYGPFPPIGDALLAAVAIRFEVNEGGNAHKPLKDLPIAEAVRVARGE